MRFDKERLLIVYSGALTLALGITAFSGFGMRHKRGTFEEIEVQRINLVEPDGRLRMVLSDKAHFPGSFIRGKEITRPDRQGTGVLFLDDEGNEMGGMMWDYSKDESGRIEGNGHLSFDQYMQDQIFSIDAGVQDGKKFSAITISDRGDWPITEGFEAAKRIDALPKDQREAEWQKFSATHPGDHNRITLARFEDKSVGLRMRDPDGHDRLVILVASDGSPTIKFLNPDGKVIAQLPK